MYITAAPFNVEIFLKTLVVQLKAICILFSVFYFMTIIKFEDQRDDTNYLNINLKFVVNACKQ